MQTRRPKSEALAVETQFPTGVPLFAQPVTPEWLEDNAASWPPALRGIVGLEAVTLAVVRWHGLDEVRFGVALWLDEAMRSSPPAMREVTSAVLLAIANLPPEQKTVIPLDAQFERLFCDLDEPVFVRDPVSFEARRQSARALGPAGTAYNPFEKQ